MMRLFKQLGALAVAGLIVPAGLVFAQTAPAATGARADPASTAEPAATASTQHTFSRIQDLAQNVRRDVGPLKVGTEGSSVTWRLHSTKLAKAKRNVNQIEQDVRKLEARKSSLPAWQQQLLSSVRQDSHELAYQTSAAIKTLNAHHDTQALVTTSYPKYINKISNKANDAATSIGNAFQQHGVDMD